METGREMSQSDFDMERFIDMFDEALTSRDQRVIDALRSLLMIVVLTKSETGRHSAMDRESGPLRKLYEDRRHYDQRLSSLERDVRALLREQTKQEVSEDVWGINKDRYTLATEVVSEQEKRMLDHVAKLEHAYRNKSI